MTREEFDIKIQELLEAQLAANSIAEELSKAEEFTTRDAFDILEYINETAIGDFKKKNEKASLDNLKSYWGDIEDDLEDEDDFDETESDEDRDDS